MVLGFSAGILLVLSTLIEVFDLNIESSSVRIYIQYRVHCGKQLSEPQTSEVCFVYWGKAALRDMLQLSCATGKEAGVSESVWFLRTMGGISGDCGLKSTGMNALKTMQLKLSSCWSRRAWLYTLAETAPASLMIIERKQAAHLDPRTSSERRGGNDLSRYLHILTYLGMKRHSHYQRALETPAQ